MHMFCAQRNPYAAWLFMCACGARRSTALDSAFWLSSKSRADSKPMPAARVILRLRALHATRMTSHKSKVV